MNMPPVRRMPSSRVPLTITLSRDSYEFVESCASLREFRSIDELFEAALSIFRHHLDALSAYVELQEAKGLGREEIKSNTQYEIVFVERGD